MIVTKTIVYRGCISSNAQLPVLISVVTSRSRRCCNYPLPPAAVPDSASRLRGKYAADPPVGTHERIKSPGEPLVKIGVPPPPTRGKAPAPRRCACLRCPHLRIELCCRSGLCRGIRGRLVLGPLCGRLRRPGNRSAHQRVLFALTFSQGGFPRLRQSRGCLVGTPPERGTAYGRPSARRSC